MSDDAGGIWAPTEFAWLIEAAGPKYWTGRSVGTESFSGMADDAVRFARQQDATRVLHYCFKDEYSRLLTVRLHGWMSKALSTPTQEEGTNANRD